MPIGRRGFYEGTDSEGVHHRIPRIVDPAEDGTTLAARAPQRFDVSRPADSIPVDAFMAEIERTIPSDVHDEVDEVLARSHEAYRRGEGDRPPENGLLWRRGLTLSWLHSRDLTTLMTAIGHPQYLTGIHDIREYALGKRLKERLASADDWYRDWVNQLEDDEPINVGFFNPNLCASLYNWGDNRNGTQNGMDAHRLAAHHVGTHENPQEWLERAVNFVIHHVPREHMGIRHEPRGDWSTLEHVLATDPSIKDSEIGKVIARDAAALAQLLEIEGKIVPWQLLLLPEEC